MVDLIQNYDFENLSSVLVSLLKVLILRIQKNTAEDL